jgi:hypothetical protein
MLPRDFGYAVEVRNACLLSPAYYQALSRHQVAHVYNPLVLQAVLGRTAPESLCGAVHGLATPDAAHDEL